MALPPRIYIAATSQHVGKTTTTLGLMAALRAHGLHVGYCKPLGQKHVTINGAQVDKDAPLFTEFLGIPLEPSLHSPVILGRGVSGQFIENPEDFDFMDQVTQAARQLEETYDLVVYEGTGHPGVGSVVDLSNADVAKNLQAGVILVVEGGVGKTLDQITLNRAIFEQRNVPILGVIVNKVNRAKLPKVKKLVGKKLEKWGIPLLGVIPFEEKLALPLMRAVQKAVEGTTIAWPDKLDQRIEGLISPKQEKVRHLSNQLLITNDCRLDYALKQLQAKCPGYLPLGGIVVTGRNGISPFAEQLIQDQKIPVIHSPMDTYEAVIEFSRIEVKLNPKTSWKVEKAVELFLQHLDLSPLMASVVLS
ncbi:MAG: AAA family ATPase [Bacteroidota bacterium]